MLDSQVAFGLVLSYPTPTKQQLATIEKPGTLAGQADVRRPLDSLRPRPDQYATLSMRVRDTEERVALKNTSAKGGVSMYNANMMIQSVSQSVTEKVQISQTFDDDRLFFFGKNLDTLNISALLVENDTFQWVHEWHTNYLATTRGTIAAERGTEAELSVEDVRYHGYITQFALTRASTDRHLTTLQFTMVLTRQTFARALRSSYDVTKVTQESLSSALERAQLQTRGTLYGTERTPTLLEIAKSGVFQTGKPTTSAEKPAPTRDAFPTEYPNTAQGLPIDQVRDVTISAALASKLSGADIPVPTMYNLADLEPEKQAVLLGTRVISPALRADAVARAAAPRTEPVFDRYVGLIPAGMPIALFQARQVGLGLLSIMIDGVVTAAATELTQAFTSGTTDVFSDAGTTLKDTLLTRAGFAPTQEFNDAMVLG